MRVAALLLALLSAPVQAEEWLPFFANGDALSARAPWSRRDDEPRRWEGLTMGTEVFAGSGMGKGGRGGFGGDLRIGYLRELDNNVVIGVGAMAGYAPSFSAYWPRGYNFAIADVKVGYDMGRLMPYVTVGLGTVNGSGNGRGWQGLNGLNGLNGLFGANSATLTKVGAGFSYEVNEHLRVGAEVNAVQVHGNALGPPIVAQPGAAP
jgi:outer membrane immunogenic protein